MYGQVSTRTPDDAVLPLFRCLTIQAQEGRPRCLLKFSSLEYLSLPRSVWRFLDTAVCSVEKDGIGAASKSSAVQCTCLCCCFADCYDSIDKRVAGFAYHFRSCAVPLCRLVNAPVDVVFSATAVGQQVTKIDYLCLNRRGLPANVNASIVCLVFSNTIISQFNA